MNPAEFIRRAISASREAVELLTPTQRFACDLRSVDRFKERYWDFARDADREDLASRVEELLASLWHSGEASVEVATIRAITPDDQEFPGFHFSGTAESLMIQLQAAISARRLGSLDSALASLDCSLETAYMYAQESEDDEVEAEPRVRVVHLSSPEHAANVEKWLTIVQAEVDARTSDLHAPELRTVNDSNVSSFRAR